MLESSPESRLCSFSISEPVEPDLASPVEKVRRFDRLRAVSPSIFEQFGELDVVSTRNIEIAQAYESSLICRICFQPTPKLFGIPDHGRRKIACSRPGLQASSTSFRALQAPTFRALME